MIKFLYAIILASFVLLQNELKGSDQIPRQSSAIEENIANVPNKDDPEFFLGAQPGSSEEVIDSALGAQPGSSEEVIDSALGAQNKEPAGSTFGAQPGSSEEVIDSALGAQPGSSEEVIDSALGAQNKEPAGSTLGAQGPGSSKEPADSTLVAGAQVGPKVPTHFIAYLNKMIKDLMSKIGYETIGTMRIDKKTGQTVKKTERILLNDQDKRLKELKGIRDDEENQQNETEINTEDQSKISLETLIDYIVSYVNNTTSEFNSSNEFDKFIFFCVEALLIEVDKENLPSDVIQNALIDYFLTTNSLNKFWNSKESVDKRKFASFYEARPPGDLISEFVRSFLGHYFNDDPFYSTTSSIRPSSTYTKSLLYRLFMNQIKTKREAFKTNKLSRKDELDKRKKTLLKNINQQNETEKFAQLKTTFLSNTFYKKYFYRGKDLIKNIQSFFFWDSDSGYCYKIGIDENEKDKFYINIESVEDSEKKRKKESEFKKFMESLLLSSEFNKLAQFIAELNLTDATDVIDKLKTLSSLLSSEFNKLAQFIAELNLTDATDEAQRVKQV